jgi:hypothetical protein
MKQGAQVQKVTVQRRKGQSFKYLYADMCNRCFRHCIHTCISSPLYLNETKQHAVHHAYVIMSGTVPHSGS